MSLLFYENLDPHDQIAVEKHWEKLRERLGDDAIGVCNADLRLIAVATWHNTAGRQALERQHAKLLPLLVLGSLPVAQPGAKAPAPSKPKPKRLMTKVREFLAAVSGPQCGEEEYQRRLAICRSNECGYLMASDQKLYCRACGCPKWRLAELTVKLRFARLACPLDEPLWGAEEATERRSDAATKGPD